MTTPHHPEEPTAGDPGPQDHPRLTEALKALYRPTVAVPASLDAEILTKARWRLARPISRILPWALPLSAAAAIALAVWLPNRGEDTNPGSRAKRATPAVAPAALDSARARREDFDCNGRVDILDAFGLARRVDRGEAVIAAWDLNKDGTVDRQDVDSIAMAAVRVR